MMTLEQAIKRTREKANNLRAAEYIDDVQYKHCQDCAEEHRQIAEWLKELQFWREQAVERQDCAFCKHNGGTRDYNYCDLIPESEDYYGCNFEPIDG